jgi:hypothetical protein
MEDVDCSSRIRKLGVRIYSIDVKIKHADITIAIRSKDGAAN